MKNSGESRLRHHYINAPIIVAEYSLKKSHDSVADAVVLLFHNLRMVG